VGDDGKPGIPGNRGNDGRPGTIKGGTFALPVGTVLHAQGQFSFTVNGPPGTGYVIQSSSNLVNWVPVLTNVAPFTFSDSVSMVDHFYRIGH
jgi:hypothetical protein